METHIQREQLKRFFDVVTATFTMILLLPVIAIIALVIKLEGRGPILYRQERLGRGRKPFQIYKFRTMTVDAEQGSGPVWASDRDPRATSVGRVLRATHLDEIPQLWNVLRGEMSLVGPRPERSHFVALLEPLVPHYADRFAARPGITGLSQIRSGYDQSIRTVRRKIRYDRFYTRRACLLFDVWLMIRTVGHVLNVNIGSGQASRRFGRSRSRWWIPELLAFGPRPRRLAGILAVGAIAAASASSSASSIQASPGSPHPRGGTDRPDPRESPPATGRTEFPWPGGAARLYASVGLDPVLVLSEDPHTTPSDPKLRGRKGGWDFDDPFDSRLRPGQGKERDKEKGKGREKKDLWSVIEEPKDSWPVIEEPKLGGEPVEAAAATQVPEPPSILLLVAGGVAWLCRRRLSALRE